MKKIVYSLVFVGVIGLVSLSLSSCGGGEDGKCREGYLDCGDGTCCGKNYPYSGGNSCWATMSGCRSSGYACDVCW